MNSYIYIGRQRGDKIWGDKRSIDVYLVLAIRWTCQSIPRVYMI
jgi:hypothetical protein